MKVLIKSDLVLGAPKPLRDVYIGIDEGQIKVISKEQPEDYDYAEYVIGGKNRVVAPGFVTTHSFLYLYPFRYRIFSGKANAFQLMSTLTPNDIYYFSLMGAYHLLKTGVTTVVTSGPNLDMTARAISEVGLRPVLAVGVDCPDSKEDWEREFTTLYNRWSNKNENRVILRLCSNEYSKEVFELSQQYNFPVLLERFVSLENINGKPVNVIGLGGGARKDLDIINQKGFHLASTPSYEVSQFPLSQYKPSISLDLSPTFDIRHEISTTITKLILTPEEALNAMTVWGQLQLKYNDRGVLENGKVADLVVFEVKEPPTFPLDYESPYESIVFNLSTPETVLVGGEAVLDGGVPLNIGIKHIEKAIERLEGIDKKVAKPARYMEKD
ncbi:amidohydrolase [Sulfolobus islandicus Y.G.57.14]|jgi:Cytosine deaminase and related metal-dependent hydrolases|uniref:Amidohydrolase n=5 Tax=Saccharolobus islandicus TaxID=43080 RepID=C3MKB6_SACI2|nr:amidohydrolase [Sulfolobus islandicus]ACP34414.1 amidohydrolase [Sulfolobus islandicus L.S.2.15]ACP37120.1 amidohydrolase [Sulfolobus islandicus M.14.25]ACP44526.1 amidohydrolase [Sulfolobus islandicus Y.G.57.14]ACP54259.1 amidohydrolase [Sulfolobus islandicus M.16.27]ADB86034.1 amidohydrolase [Sulfolobus islandicus L.D.8.5]